MKKLLLLVLVVPLLLSCGRSTKPTEFLLAMDDLEWVEELNDMEFEADLDDFEGEESPEVPEKISRKIIKTGTLNLEVKDLQDEKRRVDALVRSVNGYYEKENLRGTNNKDIYTLTIRVPSDSFQRFLTGIELGGNEIVHKTIEAKDVTLEYVDLETRLENKRLYMAQYRELLKSARSMEDILKITERVRRLEEEIESAVRRLRYLSNQVSYSTLHLTLSQNKPFRYVSKQRAAAGEKFKQAFYGGWHYFVDFLYALTYNWVGILFSVILFAVLYRKYRRWRRKKRGDNGKAVTEA